MSYSPTVYAASMVTPRLLGRGVGDGLAACARRRHAHHGHPLAAAGVLVEVLDEARGGVGVQMVEERLVAPPRSARAR